MAGVIAQLSDNDIGVNGIAPDVTLIPVRVADQDGIADGNVYPGYVTFFDVLAQFGKLEICCHGLP